MSLDFMGRASLGMIAQRSGWSTARMANSFMYTVLMEPPVASTSWMACCEALVTWIWIGTDRHSFPPRAKRAIPNLTWVITPDLIKSFMVIGFSKVPGVNFPRWIQWLIVSKFTTSSFSTLLFHWKGERGGRGRYRYSRGDDKIKFRSFWRWNPRRKGKS